MGIFILVFAFMLVLSGAIAARGRSVKREQCITHGHDWAPAAGEGRPFRCLRCGKRTR